MSLSEILKQNKVYSRFLADAQKNRRFKVYSIGLEKWNNDGSEVPKADGMFDVEGHRFFDVYGVRTLNPLSFTDWKIFFTETSERVLDFIDSLDVLANKKMMLKSKLRAVARSFARQILRIRFTEHRFLFDISSVQMIKDEMAWEKVDLGSALARCHKDGDLPEVTIKDCFAAQKVELAKITSDVIEQNLLEEHLPLNGGAMWVDRRNPTNIVINDTKDFCFSYSFDLKDGWSDEEMTRLLEIWYYNVYGNIIRFELVDIK